MFGKSSFRPLYQGLKSSWAGGVRKLRRSKLRLFLTFLLALTVVITLGAMLYSSRHLLLSHDWQIRPLPLLSSFVLYSFALALTVTVWGLLMSRLGIERQWQKHVQIYSVTNLAQRLPGLFWHIFGRMALYQQEGVAKGTVAVVSALELVLMLIAGLLVSLFTLPFTASAYLDRPELLLGGLLLGVLFLHPRVLHFLLSRLEVDDSSMRAIRYRDTAFLVGLYSIVWLLGGLILFGIVATLYPLPLQTLPNVVGAWTLSGVVASIGTFTPSGFGLREISLSALLTPLMPVGMGAVVAIAARIFLTLCELFWALAAGYLLIRPTMGVQKSEND